jgi:hypothetical protein
MHMLCLQSNWMTNFHYLSIQSTLPRGVLVWRIVLFIRLTKSFKMRVIVGNWILMSDETWSQ